MPDRNTKPIIDILNLQGLFTKLNPDLLEHNQLVICENADFYQEFGSLQKMRGTSRVLSDIYKEGGTAKPVSWVGFYKSQDFSGAYVRNTIAQLGTTIQQINTDGSITNLIVGATTAAPNSSVAQPNKLFRDHDMFDRLMLVTAQDPFKGGRRGNFFKYDGFRASNWGVIAPGRQESIVQEFESAGSFTPSGCTLSVEETIAYKDNSIKMLKTAGQASCYFEILNQTPQAFGDTIADRSELRVYIPQDQFRNLALSGRALSVYFGSDATLGGNYLRYDFLIGQLAPGWNTLTFDFSTLPTGNAGTFVGLPDDQAIKSYRFEALYNVTGTALASSTYWDHHVALDTGTPTPAFVTAGAIFTPSESSIWQYMFTFVNEYGTESNAGPASVEADLSGTDGFTDVIQQNFDSTSGWTINSTNSVVADSTEKTQGTASLKINKSSVAVTTAAITKSGLGLDLTNASDGIATIDLFIPVGVRTNLATVGVTIELGSNSAFSNLRLYNVDKSLLTEGDWTNVELDLENPAGTSGTLDLSTVDSMRVTFIFALAASTSDNLRVDNFMIQTENSFSAITLTDCPLSTDPAVVSRNIYRTVAGGTEFLFVGTINDNVTTTFSDTIPDGSLGVSTPPEPGLFNDNSPPPFATMVKVWKRTVFMAGDPLNPNVLYFSRDDEAEAYPLINGFDLDTPITGIYETSLGLIVTTETDFWRVIGDNPDYFVDKVRKGMGNTGFRACGETRMYGWSTDRDGVRLFDLSDTNKITDAIRDKFDEFDRNNLEHIWSLHSRGRSLIIFAIPNADNVYTTYLIYQYGGNDDVRQGWWWTLSLPSSLEFLCAEEIEDDNGDFHLYVGGNDGMLYDLFDPDAANFTLADGTIVAVTMRFRTPWIRPGALGAEFEGMTGITRPTFVELRAREVDGLSHNWTVLAETADGSATNETAKDSFTFSFTFPAGKSIQRYRPQNLAPGEYIRFTVSNSDLNKNVVFQGLRVYADVGPSQATIHGSNVAGQS